jgi:hypothetical protein
VPCALKWLGLFNSCAMNFGHSGWSDSESNSGSGAAAQEQWLVCNSSCVYVHVQQLVTQWLRRSGMDAPAKVAACVQRLGRGAPRPGGDTAVTAMATAASAQWRDSGLLQWQMTVTAVAAAESSAVAATTGAELAGAMATATCAAAACDEACRRACDLRQSAGSSTCVRRVVLVEVTWVVGSSVSATCPC